MTRSGHWRRERRCGGSKLKAYELQDPGGVDAMMLVEKPVPAPGPGQVLVKLKAVTINYRDLLTVKGGYGSRQKFPLVQRPMARAWWKASAPVSRASRLATA